MSIVQRKRDPRRYSMHEKFRKFCGTECARGAAFVVATEAGERADAMKVLGKRKPAWSRTAPIVYGAVPLKCANANLPDVFHGSQWASLHRPLVEHMVRHPLAQKVLTALEHTLLPDEAMLQTIAVNSRFRNTIIGNHLRFIEATVPRRRQQVLGERRAAVPRRADGAERDARAHEGVQDECHVRTKVDPTVYENDVLPVWDRWMAAKMVTGGSGEGQPGIADNLLKDDPTLSKRAAAAHQARQRRRRRRAGGGAGTRADPAQRAAEAVRSRPRPRQSRRPRQPRPRPGRARSRRGRARRPHPLRAALDGRRLRHRLHRPHLRARRGHIAAVCCQDAAAALLRRRARLLPSARRRAAEVGRSRPR